MQIEVIESVSKTIGALALAYPYLRRLDVLADLEALLEQSLPQQEEGVGDEPRLGMRETVHEGTYEDMPATTTVGQPLARITHGFTGKEDPSRKQVTFSLSVAADGTIPAWYQVADGNAADTRAYLAHLAAVRTHLHLEQSLVIGDSKLITRANCLGFCRVGAHFVGPRSVTEADRAVLRTSGAVGEP